VKRTVAYDVQTLRNPNPLARFAHQTRYRGSLGIVAQYAAANAAVLDFGAGTGEFLHQLGGRRADIRLLAFEPFMRLAYPEIEARSSLSQFESSSIDILCAFETLEHIAHSDFENFTAQARRVCKHDAKLIISVPIMQGIGLPLKEASRAMLLRRISDYSLGELTRGLCRSAGQQTYVSRTKDLITDCSLSIYTTSP